VNKYYLYKFISETSGESKNILKRNFMGTILILFGILKLYDLPKFAKIFQKYDVISNKIPQYAFLYPFIEILLGIALFKKYRLEKINKIISFTMGISIISVILSLIKGQELRCGCLGSFFHVPLSYVTLSENLMMLFLIHK